METKYVIEGQTLTDIANSLRTMNGTTDPIPVEEFANRITGIEPVVEDYMRMMDYIEYPTPLDENNFTEEKIARCTELYTFYLEMEDIT